MTALKVKGHLWMGTDPSGPRLPSMSVSSVLPFVPILATSYIVPTLLKNPVTSLVEQNEFYFEVFRD